MKYKGLIALDIDGTITIEKHHLEKNVSDFLNQLALEGWQLLFLTGRTLSFTRNILSTIAAPYYLAVQNGAALYQQPNERLLAKREIPIDLLPKIEQKVHAEGVGLLIEAEGDQIFYKSKEHKPIELAYIDYRRSFSPEKWISCEDFSALPFQEFALGKILTYKKEAYAIHHALETLGMIHSLVLRDPFRERGYIVHVNAKGASKRDALEMMKELFSEKGPVIAAGDDANDYSMLLASDVKVTMENAPEELRAIADIIAPPAAKEGIIEGLQKAIKMREK